MNIDWDDLAIALAVAEAGTLSGAARVLKRSQPTVGRRLDTIEQQLGERLFIRSPRGMTLTALGQQVVERARRMRDEASAISRSVDGRDRSMAGEVRIQRSRASRRAG